jgi:hypothetical protein
MVINVGWPRAAVYGAAWQTRFAPIILTTILVATALAGLGRAGRAPARAMIGR